MVGRLPRSVLDIVRLQVSAVQVLCALQVGAVRRHDGAFFATVAAFAATVTALLFGYYVAGLVLAMVTLVSAGLARYWSRKYPSPFPAYLRWILAVPDIVNTPILVRKALKPQLGERILEIGPGDGRMAIRVARWIGPAGTLDVFDVQDRMLELTMRRARRNGVTNVRPTRGEAGIELPYPDGAFDAAYLITVLVEIPDRDVALHQLGRVLRAGGRLIVGEFFLDPDFIARRELRHRAEAAGFTLVDRGGAPFAYLARFETPRRS